MTAWRLASDAPEGPVAVIEANQVVSCSSQAHAEGVRPGQRRREAQSRCPQLTVIAADPARDEHEFAPLLQLVEQAAPGVQLIRPGLVALRARGPARYYGGEPQAAAALLAGSDELGIGDGRAGVADGVFTAEQAARDGNPIRVVPAGEAAAFLAPLPVNRLDDPELASLLPRLGIRRLGDFAGMDVAQVRDRFGERGVRLHALAGGADSRPVQPRVPPPELARQVDFEPPLELAEQVAFSSRATAEEFVAGLAAANLVCTELRVTLSAEQGERSERVWLHPACFDAAAVVDRVRWQLQAAAGDTIGSPLVRVRLEPVATDAISHHAPGLFGPGGDELVHHALTRVQAMLGHEGVATPAVGGGRWLDERQVLVPWGDRPVLPQPLDRPWPGSLPDPLPATVFPPRNRRVELLDADGVRVRVDDRLLLTGEPAQLVVGSARLRTAGWAGPWPVAERGWDPDRARNGCRFQVADDTGGAWLLVLDPDGGWWAEGRYD
ncbi:MAG: DNA polymerase Y family protein [Propionicimonas sp.]|uniref:DNA polymerase Y family protein n=1 Tax=Propionicimonas sp. TaxID=1955623 RepID=UPI002B21BFC9|nr:DNA polymerase Y family protein [Propionicimonas sp.]MEA4945732.1 DNA polymerase Y family protein [Propionicimonas sp.]